MPFCIKKDHLYSDNYIVEAIVERISCLACCVFITVLMPLIMLCYLIFGKIFTVGINLDDEDDD